MIFGDKNPADVLKDPMWQMYQTFGQKANVPALKEYVYSLIQMASQKTAGQRKDKPKDVPFDDLNMVLWGIVIEACALVQSGELDVIDSWHSADEEPTAEHTKEYIVRDKVGIISGRLYHPGKGWGKPGRAPHEEVAEWMEI